LTLPSGVIVIAPSQANNSDLNVDSRQRSLCCKSAQLDEVHAGSFQTVGPSPYGHGSSGSKDELQNREMQKLC
jgi:hypothetical protein